MDFSVYDSKDKWVEVAEDFKIKVGYASKEQSKELDRLRIKAYSQEKIVIKENAELNEIVMDSEVFEDLILKTVEYKLKDWQGLEIDGKPVECILMDGKLSEDTMLMFYNNKSFANVIYHVINDSCKRFEATDKKK